MKKIKELENINSAVVSWSGGFDSTALVAWLLSHGIEVYPIFMYRNQACYNKEKNVIAIFEPIFKKKYGKLLHTCKTYSMAASKSQHKRYHPEAGVEQTLALRNSDIANYAIRDAMCIPADAVFMGSVKGDTYGDSSLRYWKSKQIEARHGTDTKIVVMAPFQTIGWTKEDILKWARKEDIPLFLTWSCYGFKQNHCGVCKSCKRRKESYEVAGVIDGTIYNN